MTQADLLFTERQKFNQWWIWLLLLSLLGLSAYGIYQQLFLKEPFGNNPMSDMGLLFFLLFTLGMVFFFRLMYLETRLSKTALDIRFFPLLKKRFHIEDIQAANIIRYRFIGYGIRTFTPYGIAYNMKGRMGVQIILKDGRKYLIGTQKESQFMQQLQPLIGGGMER